MVLQFGHRFGAVENPSRLAIATRHVHGLQFGHRFGAVENEQLLHGCDAQLHASIRPPLWCGGKPPTSANLRRKNTKLQFGHRFGAVENASRWKRVRRADLTSSLRAGAGLTPLATRLRGCPLAHRHADNALATCERPSRPRPHLTTELSKIFALRDSAAGFQHLAARRVCGLIRRPCDRPEPAQLARTGIAQRWRDVQGFGERRRRGDEWDAEPNVAPGEPPPTPADCDPPTVHGSRSPRCSNRHLNRF